MARILRKLVGVAGTGSGAGTRQADATEGEGLGVTLPPGSGRGARQGGGQVGERHHSCDRRRNRVEKRVEVVSQYVSDMHVLESHILQALERQVGQTASMPDIHRAIQQYAATTKQHVNQLEQHLKELGDQDSFIDKAKQGVSALFGIAAGVIDQVRTHPISKDLRDDYTAGSLSVIGYVMLRTTALACGDQRTAQLAEVQMGETVAMLQWIARTVPEVVVRELQQERGIQLQAGAAQQVTNDPKLSFLYGSQPGQSAAAGVS